MTGQAPVVLITIAKCPQQKPSGNFEKKKEKIYCSQSWKAPGIPSATEEGQRWRRKARVLAWGPALIGVNCGDLEIQGSCFISEFKTQE